MKNSCKIYLTTLLIIIASSVYSQQAVKKSCVSSNNSRLVVLIPGSGSSGENVYLLPILSTPLKFIKKNQYFRKFKNELKVLGNKVLVCPSVKHKDILSVEQRTEECEKDIKKYLKQNSFISNITLLGHSTGGLVARLLAYKFKEIDSVLTIATPHKGTVIADFIFEELSSKHFFYKNIIKLLQFTPKHKRYLKQLKADKTKDDIDIFLSQNIEDVKNIKYYSIITGAKSLRFDAKITQKIIIKMLKKYKLDSTQYGTLNDGIVPTYSQVHGEVLGHLKISHFESACVDLYSGTKGCRKVINLLKNSFNEKICTLEN